MGFELAVVFPPDAPALTWCKREGLVTVLRQGGTVAVPSERYRPDSFLGQESSQEERVMDNPSTKARS